MLKKGILIAIEGIDGAGKTTQVKLLKAHYEKQGLKVAVFKEPTDGPFGRKIRQLAINGREHISPEEEFELFLKDRIYDCEKNIIPALNENKLVLLDRYYFSSIAYQGALGIPLQRIVQENEKIAVKPDLVIILDVAVKVGLSRIKNFRKEQTNLFEKEEYLEKVREIFRSMKASYIQIIDASRPAEEVFKNVKNVVDDIIQPYLSATTAPEPTIQYEELTFNEN